MTVLNKATSPSSIPVPMFAGGQPPVRINIPGPSSILPGNMLPGGKPMLAPDACPKGYHWNKNYARGSGDYRNICVKNRTMNYGNGKALRRSIRRMKGGAKMYRQILRFTAPKLPKGRVIAKGRR